MKYGNLLELVKNRRSIRRFKPESVPDEYVDKIIEVARWAPSGANTQSWEFVVVKKQELKDSIVQFFEEGYALAYRMELTRAPERRHPAFARPPGGTPGFAGAPIFILVCGDIRTQNAFPLSVVLQKKQIVFNSNQANAILYMHLAATALGLGSQWVSTVAFAYVQCHVKELLGLPEELEIYDMMALGYPDQEPKPRPVRTREEMVQYDCYDKTKSRTDEEVRDFITTIHRGR